MMDNRQQKNLSSYIKAVWLRGQLMHITAGLLAFCRWAIPLFLVGMTIDWKINIPAPGRVAILVTLLAVSLYKAWRCGWRHGRLFNATHTALQIEEHHGKLKSLLVTAVQFQASKQSDGTSESLRQITCRRAEEAVAQLRPEETIRYGRLRQPLVVAIIFAVVIGVFAVINGPFLGAGMGRIFAPWLSIKYPTRTQLSLADDKIIVKEGEKVEILAAMSGVIPKNAKLYLRTGEGKPRRHTLEISDGVCKYNIAAAYRSFEYRFTAGDARGDWQSVEVINSPRIERAEVRLEFPEYTKQAAETVEALTVTVPESTKIKWKLTLDRPVSKATYKPAGGEPNDLDISADGLSVTMEQVAYQSRAYSFSWVEREHGFAFDSSSHFLQVAPDRPPRVELTAPDSNLYATLGRKLDLAFRGSDDHGIGESFVAYTVNKTAEKKVEFTVSAGVEQKIDWDYRSALPNLAVGDSVSFVIEVADRYPGDGGPHRERSQARRISFLSKEDYLEYITKQRKRLLTRLRAIYREERGAYEVVRTLNPAADVYIQTCQLEAVRQELMRERLIVLKNRIDGLLGDIAANNITDAKENAKLVKLSFDLQTIAKEHVGRAAVSLRELASASNGAADLTGADPVEAIHIVNRAARELGCLIMQLGYSDAAQVMAYELHATAQTQASLRLKTIMSSGFAGEKVKALSSEQDQLAMWLVQLFAATPKNKESKADDAIVAFKLSRLAKMVQKDGGSAKMLEAAKFIDEAKPDNAVHIQSEVIASLLRAEFKLRVGAEHEALVKAHKLFTAQAEDQKKLREECGAMSPDEFKKQLSEIGQAQAALHLNLQLLLMPAIPADRPRLFDDKYPAAPLVDELLVSGEKALKNAAGQISKGDRDKASAEQKKAEETFAALAEIIEGRINVVTEALRLDNLALNCNKRANSIYMLEERQLVLLEKAEDAAADKANTEHLVGLQQGLAEDAEKFRKSIILFNKTRGIPNEPDLPLLNSLGRVAENMQKTVGLLKNNQPDKAVAQQEAAFELLEEANALIAEQSVIHAGFSSMYAMTESSLVPGPLLAEIESEQRDMMKATGKATSEDLPGLVIPQKNLVHAVDAVLDSLDPLAHRIESGTAMLFAKTDMDAAAEAIEEKDIEEAQDAQSYVADSIMDIRKKVDAITPHYSYILEIVEFLHEAMPDGIAVRAQLGQLRVKVEAAKDAAALTKLAGQQDELKITAERFGENLTKLTGNPQYGSASKMVVEALAKLKSGDKSEAMDMIEEAEGVFSDYCENLGLLMENLAYLLAPPPAYVKPEDAMASAEVKLTLDVLGLAARHKDLYRKTLGATPKQLAEFAKLEKKYESQCEPFIKLADPNDHLVAVQKNMSQASLKLQGGSAEEARAIMYQADQALRYFIIQYVLEFVEVPPPAPPQDAAPSDDADVSDGELTLFMPGAVSGKAPKAGRLEWQVLGRRDRAALNENFARELPLEYRGILKDYYERLAQ